MTALQTSVRQARFGMAQPTRASVVVAAIVLVLLGMRQPLAQGITVGTLAAAITFPMWWPSVNRFRGARLFFVTGSACIPAGLWLTLVSSSDHQVKPWGPVGPVMLFIGLLLGVGVILWARERMRDSHVAFCVGLGMLLGVSPDSESYLLNPWKFGFGTALTIIVLAIAQRSGKRWLEVLVIVALIGASTINDARSAFAIFVIVLVIALVQLRPQNLSRRASTIRLLLALTAIGAVVFNVGQTLVLDGYLGDAARDRSVAQIESSGSILLGGRPEIAATIALMIDRPLGFGPGVVPSLSDITTAKTGMASIGYQPNNGYVEGYMFGGNFELHSVIGDLWATYGIVGIAFAVVIAFIVARGLIDALARNAAHALLLYLVVRGFWNLLFSPLYGSLLLLMLLVGLVVVPRGDGLERHPRPTRYRSPTHPRFRGRAMREHV